MNIKKIRKQLKKINTLFSTIEEEGKANSIERDLMKTYIVDLYEQVTSEDKVRKEKPASRKHKVEKKAKKVAATESIFTENSNVPDVKEEALESIVKKEYHTIGNGTTSSASIESVIDLVELEEEVDVQEEKNNKIVEERIEENDERYDVLFQLDENNELSSKLSKLPVSDLNAAFGLNEKIFNINELFNGDNATYQSTIKALNEVSSMDEAKEYLSQNVIHPFDWLEDHKVKKAANFIKAIQRRYM